MNLLHANDRPGAYPDSWYAATADPLPDCAPLAGDGRADVCVVGAGYTGLSAALHLARRGYAVTVLEAQRIGFGASGRNGGQVGSGQRVEQSELAHMVGPEDAAKLWEIGEAAKAKDRFIRSNLRLVVSIARRYPLPQGMDLLDLIHDAIHTRFDRLVRRWARHIETSFEFQVIGVS